MKITPYLFDAYVKCPTKCWLRAKGEPASGNAYAEWAKGQTESFRATGVKVLLAGTIKSESVRSPSLGDIKAGQWRFAWDFVAQATWPANAGITSPSANTRRRTPGPLRDDTSTPPSSGSACLLESCLHVIERLPAGARGRAAQFSPIRFVFTNKLTTDDRLLLAFDAFVLSGASGRYVAVGRIIHGDDYAALKVKTSALTGEVRRRIQEISVLLSSSAPPDLVLNRHCAECEFQARCRQKAIEKDDLSLLAGMTGKEREEFSREGTFTITQLSYKFRPRRRPKHLRGKREKYHHSLKALAIRDRKIYVVGTPELGIEGTPVYFDVEALPDHDLYYLIGLRVKADGGFTQHSFWADDEEGCPRMWGDFLSLLAELKNPCLIHYGSFEKVFLKQMCARFGGPPTDSIGAVQAIEHPINLVSSIFGQVYFPTFSNSLKEIATFLGFKWSEPDAAGPTSVTWRQTWKVSKDQLHKDKLITYNAEDCEALALVEHTITRLGTQDKATSNDDRQEPEVIRTEELRHPLVNKWDEFKSPLQNLEIITNAAHWDYQRERVYFRSGGAPRRARRTVPNQPNAKDQRRPDKLIIVEAPRCCPTCHRKGLKHGAGQSRNQHEILFGKFSLKRRLIRYEYQQYRCSKCGSAFGAEGVGRKKGKPKKYGRSLIAFLFYQIIELYIPARVVLIMLSRLFGLSLNSAMTTCFKAQLAEYYAPTHQQILDRILSGKMVHADETFVSIKGKRGYVWGFTNGDEVAYLYSETREDDLIQKLLVDFKGVLISDFYAVYDAFDCPQQKCLIHLVRDLNDLLLDNPYDEEVKDLVKCFGELLKTIIEEIDHRGLKKRFLRKFLKPVRGFYREVVYKDYRSPAAVSCAQRFDRNRDKLFTFLTHDGVPWNNNNAEHAMKAVARLRDVIAGSATEKSIREYLILLSICQTCIYQGLDFLDFLRSGEKDIEVFAKKHRGKRRRSSNSTPICTASPILGNVSPGV